MPVNLDLEEKYNKFINLESELSTELARHLWKTFPELNSKVIEYSELCADNFWTVGITSRGLYFDAYALDSYQEIASDLGVVHSQHNWDPVFTQDVRFFERIPFHVLRFLYENLTK